MVPDTDDTKDVRKDRKDGHKESEKPINVRKIEPVVVDTVLKIENGRSTFGVTIASTGGVSTPTNGPVGHSAVGVSTGTFSTMAGTPRPSTGNLHASIDYG